MGKPLWTFAGYISEAGGRIVQEWYDNLPIEEHEELQDQLNHLASAEKWTRPDFDKVASPSSRSPGQGIEGEPSNSCVWRLRGHTQAVHLLARRDGQEEGSR